MYSSPARLFYVTVLQVERELTALSCSVVGFIEPVDEKKMGSRSSVVPIGYTVSFTACSDRSVEQTIGYTLLGSVDSVLDKIPDAKLISKIEFSSTAIGALKYKFSNNLSRAEFVKLVQLVKADVSSASLRHAVAKATTAVVVM